MKHLKLMTLAVLFSVAGWTSLHAQQKAHKWEIDKSHSSVNFSIKHMGISTTTGRFATFSGDIYFDPNNLASSSVNMSIDVASINTDNDTRDKHIRGEDFFDVAKFPKMTFVSSKITKKGKEYVAYGKLTLRDKTKDIAIPFKATDEVMTKGQALIGVSAEFKINRNEYGVGKGLAASTTVGDEVTVQLAFELSRTK